MAISGVLGRGCVYVLGYALRASLGCCQGDYLSGRARNGDRVVPGRHAQPLSPKLQTPRPDP